ncbi:unnamed protein product [Mycena citricolor]|uniref:Uncharacterized protein n=1 Tax=Mycena citricolor TaxID=2018698 RepID=A0AAD2K4K4_9AGAR|nr:unnamed protein product [Mycena citricolor]
MRITTILIGEEMPLNLGTYLLVERGRREDGHQHIWLRRSQPIAEGAERADVSCRPVRKVTSRICR